MLDLSQREQAQKLIIVNLMQNNGKLKSLVVDTDTERWVGEYDDGKVSVYCVTRTQTA